MKYCLYIIQSEKDQSYYVGVTGDIKRRLDEHNEGKVKSTKSFVPWAIRRLEKYQDIKEAYKRERFIKAKKSRKIIEKIVNS